MSTASPLTDSSFLAVAANLVVATPGVLSLDDSLADIGWDSISNVEYIAHVDDELSIHLAPDALSACRTLGDVLDLTRAHA